MNTSIQMGKHPHEHVQIINAENRKLNMIHNRMHRCIITQHSAEAIRIHSSIHMFIIIRKTIDINCRDEVTSSTYLLMKHSPRNQLHRCNVPPNHRPMCSSISQQHYDPRVGHDSSRNKGQCRLTHSQGFPISQTHTVGFYQVDKELGNAKY